MKKVGLSLSFCVLDIDKGKVNIDDVAFIYSGTKAETARHWEDIIAGYKAWYWQNDDPDECERIARHLINSSLIIQPRLEGMRLQYTGRKTGGCWIDIDKFNEFCKANLKPE